MKVDEKIDMLELFRVRARLKPEKSRALPVRAYGNPLHSIQFESERRAKEKIKSGKSWRKQGNS